MSARQWFNVHSWAGLFVGALLFVTCLSGTLATLSHELEYLSDSQFRAISDSGDTDFAAIERTLNTHYPGAQVMYLARHKQDYLATEVQLKIQGSFRFVYVDGATGALLGEGPWARISRFLRNWHMTLSMGWTGKLIITSLSLLLVVLLVSSLYVYRQWWRHFLKRPAALTLSKRNSWSDWHKLLGLWSYWFILVMALTGLWYLVEHGLQTAKIDHYVAPPPAVTQLANQNEKSSRPPLTLSAAYQAAKQAFPSLDIRYISYPQHSHQAIQIRGYNDDILLRLRANKVYLHPATGAVLGIQKGEQLPLVPRLKDTADPLHFGNFAGLGTKLIWACFGALMTFVSGAGVVMGWLRVRRKTSAIRWLGVSGVIAIALVLASVVATSMSFSVRNVPAQLFSPVLGVEK
ncbi:PepSY-associated TM helix domain-containing protein [Pseudoalteromonas ruthenica]|uniref:PepSY-associated TM helix domain-containing protein n=1 Tax=Pseudoalteromonas ruthenica TaxID=151081 RepID=UPI00110A1F29|nr:PepSY-associated TM helix domain-containing protein [Pseudoalteromonas ruthenica]TMO44314.1 hypothetical protein CWC24_14400 [Pseudoalteromonas ruthenica]TMO51511.1 hypothetical protein CWC23_06160 [Pseudoalteromonas ruthenica]